MIHMKTLTKAVALVGGVVIVGGVAYYLTTRKPSTEGLATFNGFNLNIVDATQHETTTRQSTGQTGKDFRFYPVVHVVPDASGTLEIDWSWQNYFDGAAGGNSGTAPIVNTFSGLTAGVGVDLQLTDNRTGNIRNGSIAIGDVDFVAVGKQDGSWHTFESDVAVQVKSPSGATVNLTGKLGPENYKSVGALSASMGTWALNIIQ